MNKEELAVILFLVFIFSLIGCRLYGIIAQEHDRKKVKQGKMTQDEYDNSWNMDVY